ncbi:GTP cyclohydrolase N terminal-domain-containing protein [Tribonema minus]|uniref:GTP cyclohydrolase N terminal-domain-containing protein n=1 Tax=Tribonema minus TaxID=303371 RepID=A0A835YXC9_9STRA|nr:GTP cyclohydrolase N terminal-domain-containing protein [Tribonema minus]
MSASTQSTPSKVNARKRSLSELDLQQPDMRIHHDKMDFINLTTHSGNFFADPIPLKWEEEDPELRGPVVATTQHPMQRNAIGAHSGSYCIYKALAVACGKLDPNYLPKLHMTRPVFNIGPFPTWHDRTKIATMDPWGHMVTDVFGAYIRKGYDVRPTIAVTKAHIELPEVKEALRVGRLKPDGKILNAEGQAFVSKAAVEPVWYLPEIARRFGCTELALRETLFKETNMMYPELVTRPDLHVFLPPIGGLTIYIFGDPDTIADESVPLTVRVHDECNGSDVFGSDICTCRPYLTHAIEECVRTAQQGGAGVVIYYRKEGRSLGEVTKYLVYNMRKRQEGGDTAAMYFNCTEQVAGIQDTRFQALMPDPLHWLGITRIHRFISMSDMKYQAIVSTGIRIDERVEIPPELVPRDAHVEITAKVFVGYHSGAAYAEVNEVSAVVLTCSRVRVWLGLGFRVIVWVRVRCVVPRDAHVEITAKVFVGYHSGGGRRCQRGERCHRMYGGFRVSG